MEDKSTYFEAKRLHKFDLKNKCIKYTTEKDKYGGGWKQKYRENHKPERKQQIQDLFEEINLQYDIKL